MAIYPYTNTYVINKDAVAGSSFKAGMVLMMNSDGKAVPADSQVLALNTPAQKQAKILGISAGDSNLTGNTIIVQDTVGNNYLDENKNFVNASNAEYLAIKRQLLDYADETVNEYYNMNFSPIPKRRGIGVYSLIGDTFATDQFAAVLHGDYGIDGLDATTFSPGDLLTFGGGINAGKLVKVNINSFGPSVVVIGVVEKYSSTVGLLYFKHINKIYSFGTNNLTLFYDFSNPTSYTSGATVYDLSPNTKNGSIQNGPVFTSSGASSYFTFDGSNDVIETSTNASGFGIYNSEYTLVAVVNMSSASRDQFVFGNNQTLSRTGLHVGFITSAGILYPTLRHWGDDLTYFSLGLTSNQIYYSVWRFTVSGSTFFQNGNFYSMGSQSSYLGTTNIGISRNATSSSGAFQGRIHSVKIFNRGLTNTEITNMYNFEKSRYGL